MDIDRIRRLFGDQVRAQRAVRKWTQIDLAERANLSRNTISNVEAGTHGASLDNVYAIAKAFGVEPTTLLPRLVDVDDDVNAAKARLLEEERSHNVSKQTAKILSRVLKDEE